MSSRSAKSRSSKSGSTKKLTVDLSTTFETDPPQYSVFRGSQHLGDFDAKEIVRMFRQAGQEPPDQIIEESVESSDDEDNRDQQKRLDTLQSILARLSSTSTSTLQKIDNIIKSD